MNPTILVRVSGCVVMVMLGCATLASAQVTDSFHGLQGSLHSGQTLRITDQAGVVTKGTLLALSDQSLRLLVQPAGPVDVPGTFVSKIERKTSRAGKGALTGLVTGAAVGVLAVALTPPCQGFCIGPSKGAVTLPAAGLFGGMGAGIGALIGKTISDNRLVYLAPPR